MEYNISTTMFRVLERKGHLINIMKLNSISFIMLSLFSLMFCTQLRAEDKKDKDFISIVGEVHDGFTYAKIKGLATLMNEDSTVVKADSLHIYEGYNYCSYSFRVPRENHNYIIKVTADGYHTAYRNFGLKYSKRNRFAQVDEIFMRKKGAEKEVMLDGVEVRATRVKMVYKGDTIIYDASAFKLPEGSMLDALVAQLPGAELRDGGSIFVNGRKVDFLTLNGKDFFKGENKIMLENLPYFTVKNLKVYEKDTDKSRLVGRTIEKKNYVMDVVLKHEYSNGYMANATVGAGTEERWMAKLFATQYDDRNRITLFGNLNNVNEDRQPGHNGDWDPTKMEQGLQTTRQVGMNLRSENGKTHTENGLNVTVNWDKSHNEARSYRESYTDNGTVFSGSSSEMRMTNFNVNFRNDLTVRKWQFQNTTYAYVTNQDWRRFSVDSTYMEKLANKTNGLSKNRMMQYSLSNHAYKAIKLNSGDHINLLLSVSLYKSEPNEDFHNTSTYYANTGKTDQRNNYNDNNQSNFEYAPSVSYSYSLNNNITIEPKMGFAQRFQSVTGNLYRLDRLANAPFGEPGWIPDSQTDLLKTLDTSNSSTNDKVRNLYGGGVNISKWRGKLNYYVDIMFNHNRERMDYQKAQLDTVARRNYNLVTVYSNLSHYGKAFDYNMNYSLNGFVKDFADLMPVGNTSDPLSIFVPNSNLKSTYLQSLDNRFTFKNDSLASSVFISVNGEITHNLTGARRLYDITTGAYTYMNDNVTGNRRASLEGGWQRPWGKNRYWHMDVGGKVDYHHSVDYASLTYASANSEKKTIMDSPLSKVNNVLLTGRAKLSYTRGDFSATVHGKMSSRFVRGDLNSVRDVDASEFSYGWNASYKVPWLKVDLATDMTMFSRRGYETELMNTNELVWNASVARTLLKGAMTIKLSAYDLLRQLNTTRYYVTAQGRTEQWYNTIPSYAMLTLSYRISQKPKK